MTSSLLSFHTRCLFYVGDPGLPGGGGVEEAVLVPRAKSSLLSGGEWGAVEEVEVAINWIRTIRAGVLKAGEGGQGNDDDQQATSTLLSKSISLLSTSPEVFAVLSSTLSTWHAFAPPEIMKAFLLHLLADASSSAAVGTELLNDISFYEIEGFKSVGVEVVGGWWRKRSGGKDDVVKTLVTNGFFDVEGLWKMLQKCA